MLCNRLDAYIRVGDEGARYIGPILLTHHNAGQLLTAKRHSD